MRRQLLESTTAEKDLLQAMEALDDISQAVNLLDERLYEWSRLHRQEIVHGKDLAEGLCEDENMGTLARAIRGLRESRKTMEMDVCHLCGGAGPKPIHPGRTGPGSEAHLQSRQSAPPGWDALQQSADNGGGEVPLQASERQCTFAQARDYLSPSCRDWIPQKAQEKVSRALAGKLAIACRLDYYGAGTVYGSEAVPGGSPGRYQTQRTE